MLLTPLRTHVDTAIKLAKAKVRHAEALNQVQLREFPVHFLCRIVCGACFLLCAHLNRRKIWLRIRHGLQGVQ